MSCSQPCNARRPTRLGGGATVSRAAEPESRSLPNGARRAVTLVHLVEESVRVVNPLTLDGWETQLVMKGERDIVFVSKPPGIQR